MNVQSKCRNEIRWLRFLNNNKKSMSNVNNEMERWKKIEFKKNKKRKDK